MSPSARLALSLWLAVECATEADVQCSDRTCNIGIADQSSLLQTTVRGGTDAGLSDQLRSKQVQQQTVDKAIEAIQVGDKAIKETRAAQLHEAGKVEQSLRALMAAGEEIQAIKSYTNAAVGFESQAAESLKLAYEEAQQAENIQEARAYQESNVTEILHDAVQQLQHAPVGQQNVAVLQALRKAEIAQATMIQDASQEDQALAGLRQTMENAAQSATTAKLVDETQTSRTLDDAIGRLQEIQNTQLDHAKQSVRLAKSLEGLGKVKQSVVVLQESAQSQRDKELQAMQAKVQVAEMRGKELETKLASQHEELLAAQKKHLDGLDTMQKARLDAAAEHQKAEVARREASIMYEAAASSQAALEAQASKTAQSLMKVSEEAAASAKMLEGALSDSSSTHGDPLARTPPTMR